MTAALETRCWMASLALLTSSCLPVLAQSPASEARPETRPSTQPDTQPAAVKEVEAAPADSGMLQLRAAVTPYIWLPALTGNISVRGVDADIDVTISDVLEHADSIYGFMGAVDLEYGHAVFMFNAAYMHVGADGQGARAGTPAVSVSADATTDLGWYEFATGWRFIDKALDESKSRRFAVDALVGARITSLDVSIDAKASAEVTLPGGTVLERNVSKELSRSDTWVEMFIGARMQWDFAERWTFGLRGDIGGFDVGPDKFAWQAIGAFGYRFHIGTANATAYFGYRGLSQDYENDNFEWDVIAHGPILGLQFRF